MDYQKLLEISDDWLKYAIHLNLGHEPKNNLAESRNAALSDSRIKRYLSDIANFHETLVTNHKNPVLPIQKLLFLLDLGFDAEVPEIKVAIDEILTPGRARHLSVHDQCPSILEAFSVRMYSAGVVRRALAFACSAKSRVDYHEYVKPGVDHLVSLCRDNGFPCAVSPELGKFRGPGKKDDCCPYATLIMADLLSYIPEYRDSQVAMSSVKALLNLWENSLHQHPYMFYMGTDFRKMKAPSCWYDIVSVAGVLSKYQFVRNDPRFLEMMKHIKDKQDKNGLFTPESVYQKLKDWNFGQKKVRRLI